LASLENSSRQLTLGHASNITAWFKIPLGPLFKSVIDPIYRLGSNPTGTIEN
jgi:hypothetical protein